MENIIKEGRTRREFIKGAGAVVAGGVVVGVVGSQLSCEEIPGVELAKAMGYVSVNQEYCANCGVCEIACSLYNEGNVSPDLSRIQVINRAPHQIFEARPFTCWQCDGPECIYICPTTPKAFKIDEDTGARIIDEDLCLGAACKLCMGACIMAPNSPIRYVAERDTLVNCNLCDGDPYCVKFCPMSADVPGQPYITPENAKVLKFVKSMGEGADEGVSLLDNNEAGYYWGSGDGRKGHKSPN